MRSPGMRSTRPEGLRAYGLLPTLIAVRSLDRAQAQKNAFARRAEFCSRAAPRPSHPRDTADDLRACEQGSRGVLRQARNGPRRVSAGLLVCAKRSTCERSLRRGGSATVGCGGATFPAWVAQLVDGLRSHSVLQIAKRGLRRRRPRPTADRDVRSRLPGPGRRGDERLDSARW